MRIGMSKRTLALVLIALWIGAGQVWAAGPIRRFVLAAGANNGGVERELLRYAVSDAENFVSVLQDMGGLDAADQILLQDPDLESFQRGLEDMRRRVQAASRWGGGRLEVLIYYSGHADEDGLLLGGERMEYAYLRQTLAGIPADVHIGVLDACASGTITRIKGGRRHQPFLLDEASDMRGYAFLTSSSEDETAQESDRIGGSFFTHYLVSGMRGAADATGDGRVSLNEAYQFAFSETLARTTGTRGGAQHPSRDIRMSGTGDVVMTDLRHTSAGLVLGEKLSGRFYVRNAAQQLVAELFKPQGQVVELGLGAGHYSVHMEVEPQLRLAVLELGVGQRLELGPDNFQAVDRESTVMRGGESRRRRMALSENFNLDIGTGKGYTYSLGLFFNYQDKPFRGVQFSWLVNQSREMAGSQVCTIGNLAQKDLRGWQVAGMVNWVVGAMQGGQVAGALNIGRQVRGWQIAGSANIAKRIRGWQIAGSTNVAKEVRGGQIGPLNAAAQVKGWQIGVVNISEDIDGVPLGLINYSQTGLFHVSTWRDEVGLNYLTLTSGSRTFFTSFSAAVKVPADETIVAVGLGAGLHFERGQRFFDIDLQQHWIVTEADDPRRENFLSRLRLLGGYELSPGFSLFGGVSFNLLYMKDDPALVSPWRGYDSQFKKDYSAWPGFFAGIRYGR